LLVAFVRWWEQRDWSSIGLKKMNWLDSAAVLATCVLAFAIKALGMRLAPAPARGHPKGNALLFLPRGLRFAYIAADAVVEELGSRAYLVERLTDIGGNIWIVGGVSWAASLLIHFRAWGFSGTLFRAPSLLLLVALYVWRRNLLASVLAHFLVDAELSLVVMLPKPLMRWILFALGFAQKS